MNQRVEINGFTKAIWSGVTTLILARVVNWAINNEITGLYHVTNNQSIDKFTLLGLMKKHTNKNILIHPSEQKILNKSFKDNRQELNFTIPSFDEMIKEMISMIKNKKNNYSQYDLF